ncbi:hypothetical protein [Falsiroseomonas sp. CW058]|uniref:hypothetical protein n=1 Tax=Falsiroseomonas sp. CW058 TaxID=3388664 RepID=UPI003D321A62
MCDTIRETTVRRRLYVLTGVVQSGNASEVLSGCLLAPSEDAARGNHVRWMQEQKPGWLVHSVNLFPIPDDLLRDAVREIAK